MFIESVNQAAGSQLPPSTESAESGVQAVDTDAAMLPDPLLDLMSSGDPFEQIAALMTQSFRQDRKQARESAQIEERNIMSEGRKRVEAMRDEADAIRKEAYVSGATQIASGAMTLESELQLGRSANAKKEQLDKDAGNVYRGVLSSSGKATEGLGAILAGGYRSDQADLRADAAEHETQSDAAKRRSEEYHDLARDARETLDKIADFLREARAAQNDAARAAILRA